MKFYPDPPTLVFFCLEGGGEKPQLQPRQKKTRMCLFAEPLKSLKKVGKNGEKKKKQGTSEKSKEIEKKARIVRNGQSTVGGPKWTKMDLFRPKWTKTDQNFGPFWSRECKNPVRNKVILTKVVVWTILDHFGPLHFPTVLWPFPRLEGQGSEIFQWEPCVSLIGVRASSGQVKYSSEIQNIQMSEDCSRASTRKFCPKRGPRKSHEKATKKPRKSHEKGPNTVFLDRRG